MRTLFGVKVRPHRDRAAGPPAQEIVIEKLQYGLSWFRIRFGYRSTGIRRDGGDVGIDGDLTIRGVTRPVSLKAEVNGFTADPAGRQHPGWVLGHRRNQPRGLRRLF